MDSEPPLPASLSLPEPSPPKWRSPSMTPSELPRLDTPEGLPRRDNTRESRENVFELFDQIQALQERLYNCVADMERRTSFPGMSPRNSSGSWQRSRSAARSSASTHGKRQSFEMQQSASADEARGPTVRAGSNNVAAFLTHQARQATCVLADAESEPASVLELASKWDFDESRMGEGARPISKVTRRSEDAEEAPDEPSESKERCVLHPMSTKRVLWDLFGMAAVLLEVCITPLHAYVVPDSFVQTADAVDYFITSYWLLDIMASFRTAVYINEVLHFRPRTIAKTYLLSWFLFDVSMLLPSFLNLLNSGMDDETGLLRALRSRRFIRMFRFMRLYLRVSKLMVKQLSAAASVTPLLLRIGQLFALLAFGLHLLASLWFAAGNMTNGWVRSEALQEAPLYEQYRRSVEWALARLPASSLRSTVALGTAYERWLGILATIVALVSGSLFVSVVTNAMAELARLRQRRQTILRALRTYCSMHNVPRQQTMKFRRFAERDQSRSTMQSQLDTLKQLPNSMVRELFCTVRGRTLAFHPFFESIFAENSDLKAAVSNDAVSELYYLPRDTAFGVHQSGQGMYIISAGLMSYHIPSLGNARTPMKKPAEKGQQPGFLALLLSNEPPERTGSMSSMSQTALVRPEEHIAEPSLWIANWLHKGRMDAYIESRALLVRTNQLHAVLQNYTPILAMTAVYARYFVDAANGMKEEATDLPLDDANKPIDATTMSFNLAGYRRPSTGSHLSRVKPA